MTFGLNADTQSTALTSAGVDPRVEYTTDQGRRYAMLIDVLALVMNTMGDLDERMLEGEQRFELERFNVQAEALIHNDEMINDLLEMEGNFTQQRYETLQRAWADAAELEQDLDADRSRYSASVVGSAARTGRTNVSAGIQELMRVYDPATSPLDRVGRLHKPHSIRMWLRDSNVGADGSHGTALLRAIDAAGTIEGGDTATLISQANVAITGLLGGPGASADLVRQFQSDVADAIAVQREIATFRRSRLDLADTVGSNPEEFFSNRDNIIALRDEFTERRRGVLENYGAEIRTVGSAERTAQEYEDFQNDVAHYNYYRDISDWILPTIKELTGDAASLAAPDPSTFAPLLRSLVDGGDQSWAAQHGYDPNQLIQEIDGEFYTGAAAMNALTEFYRELNSGNVPRVSLRPVQDRRVLGRRFGPLGIVDRPRTVGVTTLNLNLSQDGSRGSQQTEDLLDLYTLPTQMRQMPELSGQEGLFAVINAGDTPYLASPQEVLQILAADGPQVSQLVRNDSTESIYSFASKLVGTEDFTLSIDMSRGVHVRVGDEVIDLSSVTARNRFAEADLLRSAVLQTTEDNLIPYSVRDERTDELLRWATVDDLNQMPEGTVIALNSHATRSGADGRISLAHVRRLYESDDPRYREMIHPNLRNLAGDLTLVGRDEIPASARLYASMGRTHSSNVANDTVTLHTAHGIIELGRDLVGEHEVIGDNSRDNTGQVRNSLRFMRTYRRATEGLPVTGAGAPRADVIGESPRSRGPGGIEIVDSRETRPGRPRQRGVFNFLMRDPVVSAKQYVEAVAEATPPIPKAQATAESLAEGVVEGDTNIEEVANTLSEVEGDAAEQGQDVSAEQSTEAATPGPTPAPGISDRFIGPQEETDQQPRPEFEIESDVDPRFRVEGEATTQLQRPTYDEFRRAGMSRLQKMMRDLQPTTPQPAPEDDPAPEAESDRQPDSQPTVQPPADAPEEEDDTPLGRRFRDFMANFRKAEQIAEQPETEERRRRGASSGSERPDVMFDLSDLPEGEPTAEEAVAAAGLPDKAGRTQRIDRVRFQEAMRSLLAEPNIMPYPTSVGTRETLQHDILDSPIEDIEERYSLAYDAPSSEVWNNSADRARIVKLLKQHPRYEELMRAPQVQQASGGASLDDMVERGSNSREMFRVLQAMESARQTIPPASPTPSSQPEAAVVPGQSGLPDIPTELNPVMAGVMSRRSDSQADPLTGSPLGELSP
jgi:hypothetical protein